MLCPIDQTELRLAERRGESGGVGWGLDAVPVEGPEPTEKALLHAALEAVDQQVVAPLARESQVSAEGVPVEGGHLRMAGDVRSTSRAAHSNGLCFRRVDPE